MGKSKDEIEIEDGFGDEWRRIEVRGGEMCAKTGVREGGG